MRRWIYSSWFRLAILVTAFISLVAFFWGSKFYEQLLLHWSIKLTCDAKQPPWLDGLGKLVAELEYPGFQVAYLDRNGHFVRCAGGWASMGFPPQSMQNDHRLPYASLSKIFTSIVAMQLVDENRLLLDNKVTDVLGLKPPFLDSRVQDITLNNLLSHQAGFDRKVTPDPLFEETPWCPGNISKMKKIRLDFSPGRGFSYANIGYCLVGVMIERRDGRSLEISIGDRLFSRIGLKNIVLFSPHFDSSVATLYFDSLESKVDLLGLPWRSMVATGAWVGSAGEMLHLLRLAFNPQKGETPLLTPASRNLLLSEDPNCDASNWRKCHGLLFYKHNNASHGSEMRWRDGSLPGVTAFAAVYGDGRIVVFLANSRRQDWVPQNDRLGQFFGGIQ